MFLLLAAAVLPAFSVPVHFEANRGQAGGEFPFVGRAADNSVVLISGSRLVAPGMGLRFVGADDRAVGVVEGPLKSYSNYIYSKKRVAGVAHYESLRFEGIYPDIDIQYYSREGRIEYDLLLAAGVDASVVKLKAEDGRRFELLPNGDLGVDGKTVFRRPEAFQGEVSVPVRFEVNGAGEATFRLGSYDRRKTLRIDPVLSYSLAVGGAAVTVDAQGNGYFVGEAFSPNDFGTTNTYQETSRVTDAYLAKVDSSGVLVFATFFGGTARDIGKAVAVDAAGSIYVAGETQSEDLPGTPRRGRDYTDVFVAKFSGDGRTLMFATAIGSDRTDTCVAMGVQAGTGSIYITGTNTEAKFPLAANVTGSIYVARFDGMGVHQASFVFGDSLTYLVGGSIDGDGFVYLTGRAQSTTFPRTPGTFASGEAGPQAFVTKIKPDLTGLAAGTTIGGSLKVRGTIGHSVATDVAGNVYVTGTTDAPDFPMKEGSYRRAGGGFGDVFVMKLCPDLSCVHYSSVFGGSAGATGTAIAIAPNGDAVVGGATNSADFPVVNALQEKGSLRSLFSRVSGFGTSTQNLVAPEEGGGLISVSTADPQHMLWFGLRNIYRTTDGGLSWSAVYSGYTSTFARSRADAKVVYQLGLYSGVLRSEDDGITWTLSHVGERVTSIAADAVAPGQLYMYAPNEGRFLRSDDGGRSYRTVSFRLGANTVFTHPTQRDVVFLMGQSGVARSEDAGVTWTAMPQPKPGRVSAYVIHPANPNVVYLGMDGQMYRSVNGGSSFDLIDLDPLNSAVFVSESDEAVVYNFGSTGLLVSRDKGVTWTEAKPTSVPLSSIAAVAPNDAGTYFALTQATDLFVARLNANGTALTFSTYLGSPWRDTLAGVAVDMQGNVLATGTTASDFPFTRTRSVESPYRYGLKISASDEACTYRVSPTELFNYGTTALRITVIAPSGCAWTAASAASWVTLTTSGPGTGWVEVRADANAGAARSATIAVAGQVVMLQQAGGTCTYTVTSPASTSVPGTGGVLEYSVNTQAGCGWRLESTLLPGVTASTSSGAGPDKVKLMFGAATLPYFSSRVWILG